MPADPYFHAPTFADDENFSIDRHFSVVDLPEPCGPRELNAFVSEWLSKPWDESMPLWEAAYIRKYSGGNATAAMVSRGNHTQADGQGFIMSTLYITSYGRELHKVMDEGATKLEHARFGILPPSEVSPFLRHLEPAWEQDALRPFVQVLLFLLYWAAASSDAITRLAWSLIQIPYAAFFAMYTIWRIEMVVPIKAGSRKSVFCLSKPVKLSDVKVIQRAFSGNRPGPSQSGYKGHVTVNDVLCSIMADVISGAIERRQRREGVSLLRRITSKILPMPIPFFM